MDIREMRRRISEVYDGLGWKKKVANMPDMQVYAIYMNFKTSGKFKTQKELDALKKVYEPKNECHQVTIDEFFCDLLTEKYGFMDKNNKNKEEN